jgi:hypothetical protein
MMGINHILTSVLMCPNIGVRSSRLAGIKPETLPWQEPDRHGIILYMQNHRIPQKHQRIRLRKFSIKFRRVNSSGHSI